MGKVGLKSQNCLFGMKLGALTNPNMLKSKYSFSRLWPELSVLGKKPSFSDEEPISCKTDLNIIIIIIITITIIIIIIVIIIIIIIIITITITIIIIYYYLFIYYLLSRGERVQTCSRCSDEILKVLLKKNYYWS